ncbi:MAG: diguanylate cyclase [Eubacteriales bacterium]|nr:diguanylate cyclase [Eubacteriales bacterium]
MDSGVINSGIIISGVYNIVLLLALSIVYALVPTKALKFKGIKNIFLGCIIGLIGICIMADPYQVSPGIFIDARTVLISVSGMFMGLAPTVIAAVITALFRLFLGGVGVWTGIGTIILSAAFGLLWRYLRFNKVVQKKRFRWAELYLFGIITQIALLPSIFILPWDIVVEVARNIYLPGLVINPVGAVLLSMLLLRQIDRRNMLAQLEESEMRYRSLFENHHAVMLLENPASGQIVDANPAACEFYGWSLEEIKNKKMSEINILSAEEVAREIVRSAVKNINHHHFRHRIASGGVRDVEVFSGSIQMKGQELIYSIIHDVTARRITQRKLKESEERLRVTLLSVGDGVITTDKEGVITLINKTAQEITGWTRDVIGKPINSIFNVINEYTGKKVEDPVGKVLETGNIIGLANHSLFIREDGTKMPIADSAAPIKDDIGHLLGVVLVIRDVSKERKKQQEINHLGYHDGLTGLYNRRFFDEELKRVDVDSNLPLSVIIGDVNGLKLTNDAFGHAVGDQLLKDMAAEIKKACRKEDIVARWGGDEFVVLLPKADEKWAEAVCSRIKENCARVKMSDVNFSISLGFDTKRSGDETMTDVIKSAEDYMYRKKSTESSSMRGNTINTILMTLHEKSTRERLHSKRVSELCRDIGQAMHLQQKELGELELIGLMHDIGKIAISDRILNKKGKLTDQESIEIKRHPEIGYRILSSSNNMAYIAEYVLKHHERLDGLGYPNGLKGAQIPLQSRILAIADAYDAMTSDRPYKDKLTEKKAMKELIKNAGTQFDAHIVNVFVNEVLNGTQEKTA